MTKNVYIIENSKKNRLKNDSANISKQPHKSGSTESSSTVKGDKLISLNIDTVVNKVEEDDLGVHDHDYTGGEGDTSRQTDSDGEDSVDDKMQTITFDEDKKIIIVKSGELNDGRGFNQKEPEKSDNTSYQHPVPKSRSDIDNPSCAYCGTKTKDAFNMIKHMKKKHDQEENLDEEIEKLKPLASEKCRLCDRVFLNRKTLKEHMLNIHQEFKAIQCPHCDKKYRTPYHMKMHIKHVHLRKPKSFACDHCTRRFDTKKVLQTHILYHHSNIERVHKCELCDYKYAFPKQYYEHRTRVHGPKKEVCPFCGYKCATKWYMNKHMVICCKNKYAGNERVQKVVATTVNTHQLCPDSLSAENQIVYHSSDDTLVELDQREITVPEVSDTMVDLPSVWDVQPPVENIAMDTVILNNDELVQEQVIVVKQEESCQQFTIMGPDGTQHIVQLVYPDS